MKLENSTNWPDHFLRRMVAWCCREIGMPVSRLRRAQFTKTRASYRGRAFHGSQRILIRIGDDHEESTTHVYEIDGRPLDFAGLRDIPVAVRRELMARGEADFGGHRYTRRAETRLIPRYPMSVKYPNRVNAPRIELADRMESLLHVTAHEIAHHVRWADGVFRNREARVDGMTVPLLAKFRAKREALLAEWNAAPAQRCRKPKLSRAERNEANARAKLAAWERKAKLAKTKVTQYRAKVRRYDRVAATRGTDA